MTMPYVPQELIDRTLLSNPNPDPNPNPNPNPNQELIDKTLLFNVKLVRVDEADGKGGFKSSVQDKFK